jgi:hypothetical protein
VQATVHRSPFAVRGSLFTVATLSATSPGRGALDIGYWLLVIGYWLSSIGYWLSAIGYRLFAEGAACRFEPCRVQATVHRSRFAVRGWALAPGVNPRTGVVTLALLLLAAISTRRFTRRSPSGSRGSRSADGFGLLDRLALAQYFLLLSSDKLNGARSFFIQVAIP